MQVTALRAPVTGHVRCHGESVDRTMTSLGLVLAICWLLLGSGLVVAGAVEWSSWQDNPILLASSLRWWHSTNAVPGLLAVVVAILLWRRIPFARLAAFLLATVFSLYTIFIMLITPPERALEPRPMLVLQILVLALSVLTAYHAALGLKQWLIHWREHA
jgi:hypothetical protein